MRTNAFAFTRDAITRFFEHVGYRHDPSSRPWKKMKNYFVNCQLKHTILLYENHFNDDDNHLIHFYLSVQQ